MKNEKKSHMYDRQKVIGVDLFTIVINMLKIINCGGTYRLMGLMLNMVVPW
jgi:hypothetical protein